MRYDRTDCALMCSAKSGSSTQDSPKSGDFLNAFQTAYKREFGFIIPDRQIIVDDLRWVYINYGQTGQN